jgi:hypothetical protein
LCGANNEFSNIGTLMQDDAHNWVTYGYGFYSEGSAQTEIKGTGVLEIKTISMILNPVAFD